MGAKPECAYNKIRGLISLILCLTGIWQRGAIYKQVIGALWYKNIYTLHIIFLSICRRYSIVSVSKINSAVIKFLL